MHAKDDYVVHLLDRADRECIRETCSGRSLLLPCPEQETAKYKRMAYRPLPDMTLQYCTSRSDVESRKI